MLVQATSFRLDCVGPVGTANASVSVTVTQGDADVLSTTTGTPSSNQPSIVNGDTIINVSEEPGLLGKTLTVQHIVSAYMNGVAEDSAGPLLPLIVLLP